MLPSDGEPVDIRMMRAADLEAAGRNHEAFELWDSCVRDDPTSYAARLGRGRAHYRGGRYDAAIEDLQSALEADPQGADAHYFLARCLFEVERVDSARFHFEQAVELDPVLDVASVRSQLYSAPTLEASRQAAAAEPAPKAADNGQRLEPDVVDRMREAARHFSEDFIDTVRRQQEAPRLEVPADRWSAPEVNVAGHSDILSSLRHALGQSLQLLRERPGRTTYLLMGPPNVGKKLLCQHLAVELGAAWIHFEPNELETVVARNAGAKLLEQLLSSTERRRPVFVSIRQLESLQPLPSADWQNPRILSPYLSFLSPLNSGQHAVVLLCQSDAPWKLDLDVMPRAFFKQVVLMPPPDEAARYFLFMESLGAMLDPSLSPALINKVVSASAGFHSADVQAAVDRTMQEMRAATPDVHEDAETRMDRAAARPAVPLKELLAVVEQMKGSATAWYANAVRKKVHKSFSQLDEKRLRELARG
jgi:tetratricopeptide (TPR) repeat protein